MLFSMHNHKLDLKIACTTFFIYHFQSVIAIASHELQWVIRFLFCLPQALPSYSGTVFLPRVPDLAGSKLPTSEIGAKELITEEISKIRQDPA